MIPHMNQSRPLYEYVRMRFKKWKRGFHHVQLYNYR